MLAGNAPTRYFIPFPRDSFPGRVVSFDPPKVNTDLSLAAHIMLLASHSLLISYYLPFIGVIILICEF